MCAPSPSATPVERDHFGLPARLRLRLGWLAWEGEAGLQVGHAGQGVRCPHISSVASGFEGSIRGCGSTAWQHAALLGVLGNVKGCVPTRVMCYHGNPTACRLRAEESRDKKAGSKSITTEEHEASAWARPFLIAQLANDRHPATAQIGKRSERLHQQAAVSNPTSGRRHSSIS